MEVWKDIDSEGLYQVSNLGNVVSLKFGKVRYLKQGRTKQNYNTVVVNNNSKYVHKLVAIAFLNHTPNGYKVVVDHINNNRLDNRAENLQLISQRKNTSKDRFRCKNKYTSKYTGVSWYKVTNKWLSQIRINGKSKNLGYFNSEYKAHLAYKDALKKIEGGVGIE